MRGRNEEGSNKEIRMGGEREGKRKVGDREEREWEVQ